MPVYGTFLFVSCIHQTGVTNSPKGKERPVMYEIESVRGHVEVYLDGEFCFSADTWSEAEREIAELSA